MTEEEKVIKKQMVSSISKDIRELKPELFGALKWEQYEKAAKLRDAIKAKQNELINLLINS